MAGDNPRHNFDSNENTMAAGIQNSGWRSRNKLVRRYAGRNVPEAIQEVCDYLAGKMIDAHPGEAATDVQLREYSLNKFCVAARALNPNSGAVGLNRQDDFQTLAAYWWAANDPNITESSREVRVEAFVDALAECQRKILTRGGDSSNRVLVDQIICQTGVINKFAEKFTCLHPDTTSVDVNIWAYEILRGLLGEYLLDHGANFAQLPRAEHNIDIPDHAKHVLRAKVLLVLGEVADANVQHKLDQQLAAIDYIGFLKEVPQRDIIGIRVMSGSEYVNNSVPMSEGEIRSLIANAQEALRAAERRGAQNVNEDHYRQPSLDQRTVERVKEIIRDTLPAQQRVSARDHWNRHLDGSEQNRNRFFPQFDLWSPITGWAPAPQDLGEQGNQQRINDEDARLGI